MREGNGPVKATSRKSLRVLGSVGEPINPEAWRWCHDVVGEGRCPIVDTCWPTGTGAAEDTVREDHAADIEEYRRGGCRGVGELVRDPPDNAIGRAAARGQEATRNAPAG
jgi:acyl-coenzyme A synthetase/AMP-(fatty) acid ligase